jgi:hypothetical protein
MTRGEFDLLHPGLTRYHHIGLIVPILCALFPYFTAPYVEHVIGPRHHVIMALVLGLLTGIFAYIVLKYVPILQDGEYTGSKAALLGLLSAELVIFSTPHGQDFIDDRIISAPLLIFYLFMYLLGTAEVYTK